MGHLLEIGGDDDDGEALRQRLGDEAVDLRLGADVDARRGVLGDQQLAARGEPAANHHLLLVAARQRLGGKVRVIWAQPHVRADGLGAVGLG